MSTEDVALGAGGLLPEQRVGAAMREAREAHGVSLRAMAKQLGYQSHTTLSGYERGAVMPTDAVVAGYERELGVQPGSLMAVLEAARIERHGDAWAKRRTHVPAEFVRVEGDAAEEGAAASATADEPMRVSRSRRRFWIWGTIAVLVLVAGALIAVVLTNQPAAHRAYPDGSDPKVTGCSADAQITSSVDVYYPANHLVGTLQLRTSGHCGMSWGRFTPTAALAASPTVQLEIDAHRPADGAVARFTVTYDGLAAYGNMLESDHECVYATLTLQTVGQPPSPSYQTECG